MRKPSVRRSALIPHHSFLIFSASCIVVPPSALRLMTRVLPFVATLSLLALGCVNPGANADLAQQLQEMGDAITDTRAENALLREQMDSLRTIVARQDTVLRQLSSMAGVPMSR